MSITILHLSDIHIFDSNDDILSKAEKISHSLFYILPNTEILIILISGDIAYSGKAEQYDVALDFLLKIKHEIESESTCEIKFILTPGNHDCNFDDDNTTRNLIVNSINDINTSEIDDSIINTATSIQKNFFSFRELLEDNSNVSDDLLWRSTTLECRGKKITFDCLNVSWLSKINEEVGKLYFPIGRYAKKESENEFLDLRIVILHHPFNWFNQTAYRPFRTFIRKIASLVISGHEHQPNAGMVNDIETKSSFFIEGGVLQEYGDNENSSFNLIQIDLNNSSFENTIFNWNGSLYEGKKSIKQNFISDASKHQNNGFHIKPEYQDVLDDPGAFLKHPSQSKVSLGDIYVFPDLKKTKENENKINKNISSIKLLDIDFIKNSVLIEGEEKSGKTSLLYQMYVKLFEKGFIPLLINGRDLKSSETNLIDSTINKAIEKQYGLEKNILFNQTSRNKKILLIDDFDDSKIKSKPSQLNLLKELRKKFLCIVATVGPMFEIREMFDSEQSSTIDELDHYKIQSFGHVLRERLINKWISIGDTDFIDQSTCIGRCDEAEKLINSVMQKSIIPTTPLYLLTLLQSIDAGRSGDFKDSALGHYYHYLLSQSFQNADVQANKLTELFQYSAHLAWEFHIKGKQELNEFELRDFNNRFSKEWHTVEYAERIGTLLNSRVLFKYGEEYSFKYPYIFYYLKGQYVSENLEHEEIKKYIAHCCNHLYVREHANTVLMLAHHTNDDFLLSSISQAMKSLFCEHKPIQLNGDTSLISNLLENASKLKFSCGDPIKNRTKRHELEDRLDNGHDGLADEEERSDKLSSIAQMTMLFKTTEILGQILKNQYAKIQRYKKSVLLEELFNGPLRAIREFYSVFENKPDHIISEIESVLIKKGHSLSVEERKNIARRVAADIIQVISYAFVFRTSQSVNSESLLEDIHNLVMEKPSISFKLIEMGILLDSPKPLPRQQLKELYDQVSTNMIASKIIQLMIFNRLYMFKTSERDMQWISQGIGIDIGLQHTITYQHKRQRLLK